MTDQRPLRTRLRSLPATLARTAVVGLRAIRWSLRRLAEAVAAGWRIVRPVLRTMLQILLALIIVFEEWGWQPLADLLGRLAKWRPWAALETAIARLPPWAALIVFVLPSTFLLPLKFLAVFLVARGQIFAAALLFLVAKVVATALVARLFVLTQPALMQIGWFAWTYDRVMPWKDALVERVHNSLVWRVARLWKERVRRVVRRQWWQMRPTLRRWRRHLVLAGLAARTALQRLMRRLRSHSSDAQPEPPRRIAPD